MSTAWLDDNWDQVLTALGEHARITFLALALGVALAFPLGLVAFRWRRAYPPILVATEVLYTVPSLALFVLLVELVGLGSAPVVIGLTAYSLVILVRNFVEGLRGVPQAVSSSAAAMGYGDLRRTLTVEVPLAAPALIAGLRAAAVSTISLVSVGALIGVGGLGQLLIEGFQLDNPAEVWAGIASTVVFALLVDLLIVAAGRALTPWTRAVRA